MPSAQAAFLIKVTDALSIVHRQELLVGCRPSSSGLLSSEPSLRVSVGARRHHRTGLFAHRRRLVHSPALFNGRAAIATRLASGSNHRALDGAFAFRRWHCLAFLGLSESLALAGAPPAVVICPYDPAWVLQFLDLQAQLQPAFAAPAALVCEGSQRHKAAGALSCGGAGRRALAQSPAVP